jgi:hypothetical protein
VSGIWLLQLPFGKFERLALVGLKEGSKSLKRVMKDMNVLVKDALVQGVTLLLSEVISEQRVVKVSSCLGKD